MAVNINVPSQVKTYANLAAFPATGALKTIYIAEDTNKTYRWTGSVYTEISASAAMTWGAIGGTLSNQTDLQNALDAKVPTSRTLTINGVTQDLSANRTFTISSDITIGTTGIASGIVGRILFQGAANTVQQNGNLFWDNTNSRLGLGTTSPSNTLHLASSALNTRINISNSNATPNTGLSFLSGSTSSWSIAAYGTNMNFTFYNDFLNADALFITRATNNIGINTTTDSGFRLDVNGTARVQSAGEVLRIQGTTATGNSYIQYRNTSGNLGYIGWGSSVNNHFNLFNQQNADTIFGTNNIERLRILAGGNVGIGTATSSSSYSGNARVLSIVDNATSNVGSFRAYGGGTTTSVELYGSLSDVGLFGSTNHPMVFWTNSLERLRIHGSTGNVGINTTTDAGFRLDVNGTARVSGSELRVGNLQMLTSGSPGATGQGITTTGRKISFQAQGEINADFTSAYQLLGYADSTIPMTQNATGRTMSFLQIKGGFSAPNFNNTNANVVWMNPVYNMSGTSNAGQILRGIYYNPTLTDLTNATHYAFHSTSGLIRFENLPTSSAGLPSGTLYNNLGVLMIA